MRTALSAIALFTLLLGTACAGDPPPDTDDGWRIERETVDGVEVVRNLSGSKWGAPAQLVEELSIGVMEGDEHYMLARPFGLWATDNEIVVLDSQDARVLVYDREGTYLRQFGSPGQGPGEFENAFALVVTDDDRVLVGGGTRITVFSLEGEFLETWQATGQRFITGLFVTPGGVYTQVREPIDNPTAVFEARVGFQQIGPDGLLGEPEYVPDVGYEPAIVKVQIRGFELPMPIPFSLPTVPWTLTPGGAFVYGSPAAYSFLIRTSDGSLRQIERFWDPVPIDPDEADYRLQMTLGFMRRMAPDLELPSVDIPTHKQAFGGFVADREGRIWVAREGPASRVEECTAAADFEPNGSSVPCWHTPMIWDLFDLEGTYLGSVEAPEGVSIAPRFIGRDVLLAPHEDDFGTPMVKVYRIVLPPGAENVED